MQKPTRILGAAIVAAAGKHTHPGEELATYIVETGKPVASPVK